MTLRDYFQPAGQQQALEQYSKFACDKDWSIEEKIRLYNASNRAFNPTTPDPKAFDEVYNILRGWQAFRGVAVNLCWSPQKIFDTFRNEFSEFAWGGCVALPNFVGSGKEDDLLIKLPKMREIKPNQQYPVVAVSKFLHGYNPSLFPVYDNGVIWEQVFRRFKNEFREFCRTSNVVCDLGFTPLFLRNYVSWASSLLASAHPKFMETFVDWLNKQPGGQLARNFDALTLYATAFEFAAIGAAKSENTPIATVA
jgi:hypothetical protein